MAKASGWDFRSRPSGGARQIGGQGGRAAPGAATRRRRAASVPGHDHARPTRNPDLGTMPAPALPLILYCYTSGLPVYSHCSIIVRKQYHLLLCGLLLHFLQALRCNRAQFPGDRRQCIGPAGEGSCTIRFPNLVQSPAILKQPLNASDCQTLAISPHKAALQCTRISGASHVTACC